MARKPFHHLTYDDRIEIFDGIQEGRSIADIARVIGVHRTTVYRELRRNSGACTYNVKRANNKAVRRKRQAATGLRTHTQAALPRALELLTSVQASPEQICGRLAKEGIHIGRESIYRYIRQDKANGGELHKLLRRKGRKRRKVGKKDCRSRISDRVDISERPAVVEEKSRFGDFEIDLIAGGGYKFYALSLVDRASKLTILRYIPKKTKEIVTQAIVNALKPLAEQGHVLTITSDNGHEFAGHAEVTEALGAPFFFARPGASWERGLNEHTNGLVRQYLPKGSSFKDLTPQRLAAISAKLNSRPRRVLDFKTPIEMRDALLSADK